MQKTSKTQFSLGLLVRIFLGLYKMIAQKGGKLIIRNLQPLVKNVFDMSGFSQIFAIE